MILVIIMYTDNTTKKFIGQSINQTDKALHIYGEDSVVAIPSVNIRAYQVKQHEKTETPQSDSSSFEGQDVPQESSQEQETPTTPEEEAP